MTSHSETPPWEQLEQLMLAKDAEGLRQLVDELSPADLARAFSRMDDDVRGPVLTLLDTEYAAGVIEEMSDIQAAEILADLDPRHAAGIVQELDSDEQADLLASLRARKAEAVLREMDPEEARDVRNLLRYKPYTAGGLMITEYLAFSEDQTISDALSEIKSNAEEYSDYSVQYIYVVEANGLLTGIVPLRNLVLSRGEATLASVMIRDPVQAWVEDSLDSLSQLFERYAFLGVPVTDEDGVLVGVVQRAAVEEAEAERNQRTFMRLSGIVGGEEVRSISYGLRLTRRLSWLLANIPLNLLAVSVIAFYEDTLAAVIALAVFLPIVSDMSGNVGSQAVAVSIRELTLGVTRPADFMRVLWKEVDVGMLNGLVLGLVLGAVSYFYSGSAVIGVVICLAMALNTVVSGIVGGLLPLGLKAVGIDPALASVPILTTITDMGGFFFVLGFAAAALSYGVIS